MLFDSFWMKLRLYWVMYVVGFSATFGLALTLIITAVAWISSGSFSLESQQLKALYEVASFWFTIAWIGSFLVALVFSFKKLFNKEIEGKRLLLLDCESKEPFIPVILLDVMPLWRKFLFFMVWILVVVALLLLFMGVDKSFFGGSTLFIMILLFGALILPVVLMSVKNVRRSEDLA